MLNRTPSITMPTTIAFFIAVASGIILRRRYTWVGLVIHIYGQIVIWLSLFTMSLALVLFVCGKGLGSRLTGSSEATGVAYTALAKSMLQCERQVAFGHSLPN